MDQTNPKVTALEWHASDTSERIVASMSFDNCGQACRFVEAILAYILSEQKLKEAA